MCCVYIRIMISRFVINRDSCHNILPLWSRGWREAKCCRSLVETSPGSEYRQLYRTVSTNRLHSWMCVRTCVLTPLLFTKMKCGWFTRWRFFLLWPWLLVPASSREDMTRRWILSLLAFHRHHLQSQMSCRENRKKKVTFHDVTVDLTVVGVDDQSVLTDHIQTERKDVDWLTRHSPMFPRGNSAVSRVSCLRLSFHRQRAQSQHLSSQSLHPRIDPPLVGHSWIQQRSSWLLHQERQILPNSGLRKQHLRVMKFGYSSGFFGFFDRYTATLDIEHMKAQSVGTKFARLPRENEVALPVLGHSDARCPTWRHNMHSSRHRRRAWCSLPRVVSVSVGRFLGIVGRDSEGEVGRLGKTTVVPWFDNYPPSIQESSLWNAWHETEAHVLLENCNLLMQTLEMRMHQRLPGCHQTVQDLLGHLSEDPLCMLILPTRHHRRHCGTQHRLPRIHRHHIHTHQSVDQHSWQTQTQSHSKSKSLLISELEIIMSVQLSCIAVWIDAVQCLIISPYFRRRKSSTKKSNSKRTPSYQHRDEKFWQSSEHLIRQLLPTVNQPDCLKHVVMRLFLRRTGMEVEEHTSDSLPSSPKTRRVWLATQILSALQSIHSVVELKNSHRGQQKTPRNWLIRCSRYPWYVQLIFSQKLLLNRCSRRLTESN